MVLYIDFYNREGLMDHLENGNEKQYKGSDGIDGILQEPAGAAAYLSNADSAFTDSDSRIPSGGGHTEEEYLALPDDLRVELIDGVFYAMASPSKLHQAISIEIVKQLSVCLEEHGMEEDCLLFAAPSDVPLGEEKQTVVQPDIYVHCGMKDKIGIGPRWGTPDFVIEILSPSNPENDLWRKHDLYKRSGVREYWIIDPEAAVVYVFIFDQKGEDTTPDKYTFEEEVPVSVSGGICKVNFKKIAVKAAFVRSIDLDQE